MTGIFNETKYIIYIYFWQPGPKFRNKALFQFSNCDYSKFKRHSPAFYPCKTGKGNSFLFPEPQ